MRFLHKNVDQGLSFFISVIHLCINYVLISSSVLLILTLNSRDVSQICTWSVTWVLRLTVWKLFPLFIHSFAFKYHYIWCDSTSLQPRTATSNIYICVCISIYTGGLIHTALKQSVCGEIFRWITPPCVLDVEKQQKLLAGSSSPGFSSSE